MFKILIILFFFQIAFSDELIEINQEFFVKDKNPNKVKAEIQSKILDQIVVKQIKDIIGQENYSRYESIIKKKILAHFEVFIPILTIETPADFNDGMKAKVSLKFSVQSLQNLLLKNGLNYQSQDLPVILPFIYVLNKSDSLGYKWWVTSSDEDTSKVEYYHNNMIQNYKEIFNESGFYFHDPNQFLLKHLIPKEMLEKGFPKDDLIQLGHLFGGDIIIKGFIYYEDKGIVKANLEALDRSTGQVIAEVAREFKSNSRMNLKYFEKTTLELGKEMLDQIKAIWERGAYGAQTISLKYFGPMDFKSIEELKSSLEKVTSVRAVKERFFGKDFIIFETETTSTIDVLYNKLESLKFKVSKLNNETLEISH